MTSSEIGKLVLEIFGFSIGNDGKELVENDRKKDKAQSADFLVSYQEKVTSIVEVKLKTSDKEEKKKREEILSAGKVYESKNYGHNNESVHTILRKANVQIRESVKDHNSDFNILLFVMSSYDANILVEQTINSLYGKMDVWDYKSNLIKPCYFYEHNLFKRMESVDMVLIAEYQNYDLDNVSESNLLFTLCLNPFSEKESLILEIFESKRNCKLINPNKEIEEGIAYTLDNADWEKINELKKELEQAGCKQIKDLDYIIPRLSARVQVISNKYAKYLVPLKQEKSQITIRFKV